MSGPCDLVRDDLRSFAGYRSARCEPAPGDVWLDANESPWPSAADPDGAARRYPEPQPRALGEALSALYGCGPQRLLIGRGSDEAIDLLVRATCAFGRDAVAISPPVFGMYAVCARLQGARLVEVPQRDAGGGWRVDLGALGDAALDARAKVVFLCSPGNPTGEAIAPEAIAALAGRLRGTALLVVDEAYGEFSTVPSAVALLDDHSNVAVLRTLSKAHAIPAARVGCLVADAGLVALLRRCQAPYPVPGPSASVALAALAPDALARTGERVGAVRRERARLFAALCATDCVRRVYPSQGNFLLARFDDATRALERLRTAGVVVRDMRATPRLEDALRISVGTPAENDRLLAALGGREVPS